MIWDDQVEDSAKNKWKKILKKAAFMRPRKAITIVIVILYTIGNSVIMNEILVRWEGEPCSIRIGKNTSSKQLPRLAVVLGGFSSYDVNRNYFQLSGSADRFMTAYQGVMVGNFDKVIISGGSSSVFLKSYLEADEVMKYAASLNMDTSKLIKDAAARNTYENAVNTKKILHNIGWKGPIVLITSAIHMRRSEACFKKQGIPFVAYRADFSSSTTRQYSLSSFLIPSAGALSKFDDLVHEIIGIISYKISGKI